MTNYKKIEFKNVISNCKCQTKADIFISKIGNEPTSIALNLKDNRSHFVIYSNKLRQMIRKMRSR